MFDYKQVMVVRDDLDMSKGKLAVQVAHASLSAAEKVRKQNPEWYENWRDERQKKVVVKVSSEKKLKNLKKEAEIQNLPNDIIKDAGLTELPPETPTVLGIGPAPNDKVDKVTGDLKLLGD